MRLLLATHEHRRTEQASTAVWRPWLLAWAGGAGLAVANGTMREYGLDRLLDEESARQLSTLTLLLLLTGYIWILEQRWPLTSARTALLVGAAWVALTVGFEFALGHFVEHKSWETLLADYDLTEGRVWLAVPLWTLLAPAAVRAVRGLTTNAPLPTMRSVRKGWRRTT